MRLSPTRTILVAALLAVGAIVGAAATVSAQTIPACSSTSRATMTADLSPIDEPIKPITGSKTIRGNIHYTYPPTGASVSSVTLTYTPQTDQSGYTTVTLNKATETVQIPPSQTGDTLNLIVDVTIKFSSEAPAFKDVKVWFTAEAGPGECTTPVPAVDSGQVTVKPDFYSKFTARLDQSIFKTGQANRVALPLVLKNSGNGQIIVSTALGEESKKTNLEIVTPPDVTVGSTIAGQKADEERINIELQTPFGTGYKNEISTVTFNMESRSFDDQNIKGNPAKVTAQIRTQGVYVPAFEAPLALLGVALAGMLAYRRKDE